MSRRKPPSVKEDVTCNLIPMIDIMFLLLLFFMLSADMSQREFEDVILPQADQVKEDDAKKNENALTTINVFHRQDSDTFSCPLYAHGATCRDASHWLLSLSGHDYTRATIRDQLKTLADLDLEPEIDPAAGKQLSARQVMIRADRQAPYGDVQALIQICGEVGIYKIEVAAAAPPKA